MQGKKTQISAKPKKREVLAFLGFKGQKIDGSIDERIDAAMERCAKEMEATGIYSAMDVGEALKILPGESIRRHLDGCSRAILMVVTLGQSSEMALRRQSAINKTDGVIFDACASSLVEQAASTLDKMIENEFEAQGFDCTYRFSPGYGDLPLSCQPALLEECGADKALGIVALDSGLMVPSKSITAIIGLTESVKG